MERERPIKILRIITRMNIGGPAWQVSVLIRGLDPDQFESQLISGQVADGEADFVDLRDPELPILRVAALGRSIRFGDDFRALVEIRRIIVAFRPDIVHTHTAKAGLVGRLAAVTSRVPITVHTFHGHTLHSYFKRPSAQILRFIESRLANHTTSLVAVGGRVRDDLLEAGIGRVDQYSVIPPGVDLGSLPNQVSARIALGLPPDRPVVLFVGRLTAVKRPDRLIDAMACVLERLPDTLLVVAGEGDLFDETRLRAKPLGPSVRFLGWRQDLNRVYAAADVAVLTSDNEGMPVSLIEASLSGLPSVTTNVGSAGEVVVDGVTGRVVEATAGSVADALVELLSDEDLRSSMGEAAQEHSGKAYGVGRLIRDHEALYHRLLSERPRGRLGSDG